MSNRIESFFQKTTLTGPNLTGQVVRPTLCAPAISAPQLKLNMDRPFTVDMERFFEFSFSFAEALVDLEDRYTPPTKVTTLDRFQVIETEASCEEHGDIDARWM